MDLIKAIEVILASKIWTLLLLPVGLHIYKLVKKRTSIQKNTKLQRNIEDVLKADHLLQDLLKHLPINRACVFLGHNSGGIPSFINPMYTSCLNEASSPSVKSIFYDIQKVPIDAEQTQLIRNLLAQGQLFTSADTLGEQGKLKPMYLHLDTSYTESNLLASKDGYIVYLTLFFTPEAGKIGELTATQRFQINTAINQLKNLT